MKKLTALALASVCTFCFGACSKVLNENKSTEENHAASFKEIDIKSDPILSFEAFHDDYVVYMTDDGERVKVYAGSDKKESVGTVSDFVLSMRHKVLDYPNLYFFAACLDNTANKVTNVLFRVNIESSRIDRFENDDGSEVGIPTYLFNGKILTLKYIVTGENTVTCIEAFDVENNEWTRALECSLDNKTNKGDAVFAVCANEKNVFALCDKRNGENEIETYLITWNDRFEEVSSIRIDRDVHDYVMTGFISDFQAFEDYIYIINASNYGFLGKIENGQIAEIFRGRNFTMALNQSGDMPVFYTRRSNSVYVLNDSGELQEQTISVGNGYSIMFMMTNGESCFTVCRTDDKDDRGYVFAKKDLGSIALPCD